MFVAKCDAITNIPNNQRASNSNQLFIYANPNKGICYITVPDDLKNQNDLILRIYAANGKLIQQQPVQMQQEKIIINIEAEAKGIYNVTLGNKDKMYAGKIVFE